MNLVQQAGYERRIYESGWMHGALVGCLSAVFGIAVAAGMCINFGVLHAIICR